MTDAEAPAPTTTRKTQNKKLFNEKLCPLQLYQLKHCQDCRFNCNPSEQRFLTCVLTALLDTTQRNNQLNKQRGAHR